MILKDTFSTPTLSTCLMYSLKKYFELKRAGYIPELVFTNFHFRVYVWTTKTVTEYDFYNFGTKLPKWLFMLIHTFIPFKGYELIQFMEIK